MNCPVCDRGDSSEECKLYDDRYGFPRLFRLLACRHCEHRYLDAHFDQDQIQQLYTDYYPRRHYAADFKPLRFVGGLRGWLRGEASSAACWVPRGVRVLDVGCGVGEALAYYQQRGCEAHGVEADANVRRIADALGVSVRIGVFDPAGYPPEYFDYVTLDQVIEHMPRPVATLEGLRAVLREGGCAVLTTPNPRGWGREIIRPPLDELACPVSPAALLATVNDARRRASGAAGSAPSDRHAPGVDSFPADPLRHGARHGATIAPLVRIERLHILGAPGGPARLAAQQVEDQSTRHPNVRHRPNGRLAGIHPAEDLAETLTSRSRQESSPGQAAA
jgi:SAM-dependent methyltransferase